MTQARHNLIDPEATSYYHCIARCVRRAFLFGLHRFTGKTFDHRKGWIVERLAMLAEVFCVRVCAYAVMSNHLHLVLRMDPAAAADLTSDELARRHARLFPLVHAQMQSWDGVRVDERLELLLDDTALVTCMSYVDLNPVRAGLADGLEGSDFTSIQQRLEQAAPDLQGGRCRQRRAQRAATRRAVRPRARLLPKPPLDWSASASTRPPLRVPLVRIPRALSPSRRKRTCR